MKSQKKPKLEDLELQISELTEALQRERADAINVRRRADEDRAKLGGYFKAMVIQELLPALDNLERALKHAPKEVESSENKLHDWVKGIAGIKAQFDKALSELGVERIKTVGEVFNPSLHEAVSLEDGDGDTEMVIEELQAGYKLGDEIIRHAMVKVRMEQAKNYHSSDKSQEEAK